MDNLIIRQVESSDYQPIISVLNDWWGGRNMSDMLPKLFLSTSGTQALCLNVMER